MNAKSKMEKSESVKRGWTEKEEEGFPEVSDEEEEELEVCG